MRAPTDCAPPTRERLAFQTACVRDVRVGPIALGDAKRPARRVTLDIAIELT